jgi:hypothetical protein
MGEKIATRYANSSWKLSPIGGSTYSFGVADLGRVLRDDAAEALTRERGQFWMWTLRPDLIVTRARGFLHHDFARALIDRLAPRSESGVLQLHDWYEVDQYDVRCQADLTTWHTRHLKAVRRLDICVRSPLVRMGVSVANVPLRGRIRLHTEPSSLYAELEGLL